MSLKDFQQLPLGFKTKFIFITGGVFSSLGKGILAASIGCILTDIGYNVAIQKWDPYLNIDPGTMSPYQHGEVFVTNDGSETDLDLGNYERFLRKEVNSFSSVTAGRIYNEVLTRERQGVCLGKTIQVIPDLTNRIQEKLFELVRQTNPDFVIVEVGGTVGDVESIPFLETIRQILGNNNFKNSCLVIHCAPLIYLKNTNEYKTKPLQHSIRTLGNFGIIANLLVIRSDKQIYADIIDKISFMCNVEKDHIFKNPDLENIYFLPEILFKQKIHKVILQHFNLTISENANIDKWLKFTNMIKLPHSQTIKVALVGKYTQLHDAYASVIESLKLAGYDLNLTVEIIWIDARTIKDNELIYQLEKCHGLLVPGGFGIDGTDAMIIAIKYAREHKMPFLGLCLGMQLACIEFAKNCLQLLDANTGEFASEFKSNNLIFHLLKKGEENFGGTLRLGNQKVTIKPNTKAAKIYNNDSILRRHRHRYEFNNKYVKQFEDHGFIFSGFCLEDHVHRQELFELKDHPFFMGCQYHPEFESKPLRSEGLFLEFLRAIKSLNEAL